MNAQTLGQFWNTAPETFAWQPRDFRSSSWSEHVPFAFWIVEALRPTSIVELGTWHGMSYLAFCQALTELNLPGRAKAVDTWQGDTQAGSLDSAALASLRSVHDAKYGSFSELLQADFDTANAKIADDTIDLLHIDGLHTYDAVRHDFETWLPKMTDRGVILFHDTQERRDDFGVYRLWDEVSARYPHFEFVHEHGLGVLGVGKNLSPSIADFLNASQSEADTRRIRAIFERLGADVRARQRMLHLEDRIAELKANPVVRTGLAIRSKANRILNRG